MLEHPRIWDSLKVIVPKYSCRVTLRTANWEVSFENVARIDFTWFSYCQNNIVPQPVQHLGWSAPHTPAPIPPPPPPVPTSVTLKTPVHRGTKRSAPSMSRTQFPFTKKHEGVSRPLLGYLFPLPWHPVTHFPCLTGPFSHRRLISVPGLAPILVWCIAEPFTVISSAALPFHLFALPVQFF